MNKPHHHRGFVVSVFWTLGLLFLGSVVHATESSLACPDWPTCFGTMVPEMSGGVFWEHLHRLVAGGLVLIFAATVYVGWSAEPSRPWIRKAGLAGIALLLVQSLFGGLTVLMRLPDAVSTTHLALAFLFLGLATVLAVVTSPEWGERDVRALPLPGGVRVMAVGAAALTFLQSVLGGLVRHMDAGLVCPDVPTCLGRWIPPLVEPTVSVHFAHRITGVLLVLVVIVLAIWVVRRSAPGLLRGLAIGAAVGVVAQIGVGVLSVTSRLGVAPVSLHTLLAAGILCALVALATLTWRPVPYSIGNADAPTEGAAAHGR